MSFIQASGIRLHYEDRGGSGPVVIFSHATWICRSGLCLKLGEQTIVEILGQAGDRVRANLADIAADFATYVLEVIHGDIYRNDLLDAKMHQLVTVAHG